MSNKKILLIDSNIGYMIDKPTALTGGATIQTKSWLSGFEELGFKIHIITERVPKNNNNYHFIDLFSSKFYSIIWSPILIIRLFFILKRQKYKFVYVSTAGWQTIIYGIATKLTHTFYIQRISNNIVYEPLTYRKRLGFVKYYLSRIGTSLSNIILVQNNHQLANLKSLYPSKSVHIMHNPYLSSIGIDVALSKGQYIAWIGIFQYQKNLPALFDIANSLPNLNFKIAGSAAQLIDKMSIEAIDNLKRLPNVEFVGKIPRTKISEFISKSICLLNTSHYEGFSNTFLEALESGRPIVTTDKVDPDSIIKKYKLGYVAKSFEDIPNLLIKASTNYEKFYDHNRQYLKKNHDPATLSRKLLKHIEDEEDSGR
ncbi:MAG: glycosyltransferase [Bacteroidales bacterium]|jgi:glycosyltransferase involved in cell wall biosynthesis|nr:glycosyltransferase [Bacteroidales bacterium]